MVAVQSFFKTGFLPKGINSTILALIKKTHKLQKIFVLYPAATSYIKSSQRS